ncbi:MAG: hypothetical protein RL150_527 [Candidatus Parcubacteria bacterium]
MRPIILLVRVADANEGEVGAEGDGESTNHQVEWGKRLELGVEDVLLRLLDSIESKQE